jgi:hypothetical protein
MRKALGVFLVLAAGLLFVPFEAAACRSCDVPEFWDSNCSHSGCTYCLACSICCGGDPGAGGNCETYCGGPAFVSRGPELRFSQIFLNPVDPPSEASGFLATLASPPCPPTGQ